MLAAGATPIGGEGKSQAGMSKYVVSPEQLTLSYMARWHVYGKHPLSKSLFDDEHEEKMLGMRTNMKRRKPQLNARKCSRSSSRLRPLQQSLSDRVLLLKSLMQERLAMPQECYVLRSPRQIFIKYVSIHRLKMKKRPW